VRAHERRLFNQAFFTRIFVNEDRVETELAEPFRTLNEIAVRVAAEYLPVQMVGDPVDPPRTLTDVLLRQSNKPADDVAGLKTSSLVPPAGFEPATPALGEPCSIP
jgi:site-specific DNA recombinase